MLTFVLVQTTAQPDRKIENGSLTNKNPQPILTIIFHSAPPGKGSHRFGKLQANITVHKGPFP